MSAFYFDIRKDALYCDVGPACPGGTAKRRAYRTALDTLFHALVRYAAPVLVFTAEEVWGTRFPDAGSVHLLTLTSQPDQWRDDALAREWTRTRSLRRAVLEAIEPLRRDKTLGSSLEAEIALGNFAGIETEIQDENQLAELFISARVHIRFDTEPLAVTRTTHHKCGRCWRHLPEVTDDGDLCTRCEEMVHG